MQHCNPDREAVAHFVNQLVFCFFADSVGLLPHGVWRKLLEACSRKPEKNKEWLAQLFADMKDGGDFNLEDIAQFNGGLFDGREPLRLEHTEIGLLSTAASLDWSLIDPTIFGTLFEGFLDPDKRAQIGAHYTGPDKIMMIVEPVAAPGEAPRRYPDRVLPRNVEAAIKLKERTLTNLYNQRRRWLAAAHEALDRAVAAAYAWPEDITTDDALQRLLAVNLERAAAQANNGGENAVPLPARAERAKVRTDKMVGMKSEL